MNKNIDQISFFHLDEEVETQSLFIGSIQSLSQSLVIVELKSSGVYWINNKTIEKLISITKDKESLEGRNIQNDITKKFTFPFSYFIVRKDWVGKLYVFSAIDTLLMKEKKIAIALDGNASSGKTSFGKLLNQVYDCNLFHIDNYFQKPVQNQYDEYSHYARNINFNRIRKEILIPIEKKEESIIQKMDFKTHTLSEPITMPYQKLSIIEGAYSMHPYIIDNYDLKVFMKVSYFNQIKRIYKRNGFKKLLEFMRKWIPMENKYFRRLKIESKADIILKSVK
ncbi:MAG: deoxynucleoside kinase [Acholeplasmataceae bacterium]|nr:deoxynucleoside kinase [Acholeplasmataceae bacterium]